MYVNIHDLEFLTQYSVPARLGKGRGAKEIGHNLAREQPKCGHNLVRERHIIVHSLEREWPKFGRNPAHERNEVWDSGHNFVSDRWKNGHKSAGILQAFLHPCLKTQK